MKGSSIIEVMIKDEDSVFRIAGFQTTQYSGVAAFGALNAQPMLIQ
jgi:hypothetical protein